MLEIVLVIVLCRHLGGLIRAKGRKAWPYQTMLVLLWFGGEFMAGIVYGVVYAIRYGGIPDTDFNLAIYAVALVGGGLGAGLVYLIAALLPTVRDDQSFSASGDWAGGDDGLPPIDPNNPYASPRNR